MKILSKRLQKTMFRVTAKVRLHIETTLRGQAKVYVTSAAAGSVEAGILEDSAEVLGVGVEKLVQEGSGTQAWVRTPLPS
jgi:hypothetical protein